MRKTFLEQNPFYILEVSPNEKRASIISKAEEKAFFSDSNECEEAQAKLLNPEKRLNAELDWFYEISIEKTADIHNCICESKIIDFDGLIGVSRLNAVLHNFSLSNYDDYLELGYAILEIDELYNSIDLSDVLSTINTCRQQSGFREISEDELAREFNKKRDLIRQFISNKLIDISEEDYVDFITMIAEKCIADDDYDDGIIISDVIDQYEIKLQSSIETAANEVYSLIERTKELSNDEAIENNITDLIRIVKKWDRLVQPLQLKAMSSGMTHSDSEDIGRELHDLSVWLHNEKKLSDTSLRLINAIKPIFAEIGNLTEIFDSDSDVLTNIIKENAEAERVVAEINSLKTVADNLKLFSSYSKVEEFIEKVKKTNIRVKLLNLDSDLIEQVRTTICYIARDVLITLHNNKHQTEYALKIANMLVLEFSDISKIKLQLLTDSATLTEQSFLKRNNEYQNQYDDGERAAKGIGCFVVIGIIFFIFIFVMSNLSERDSSNSSNTYSSRYSNNYGYGYSNNYNYSYNYSYSSSSEAYTIILDKQDGTGGSYSVNATYGRMLPYATAPTRSGYEFNGYYQSPNGKGTQYYDSNMNSVAYWYGSSNDTIYAYWVKSKNDNKYTGISITKDNFEEYFTLTTDAEYVGDNVKITYSIKPKSSSYAKKSASSKNISVEIGAVVSSFNFSYVKPAWDKKHTVTLKKSKNYTASGSFSITHDAYTETVYWLAEVTDCSGTIGN